MSDINRKDAALAELQQKSIEQIQRETARTWAYRAWAAKTIASDAWSRGDSVQAHRYGHDAIDYEHEALEHAALCGDDSVIAAVRALIASV